MSTRPPDLVLFDLDGTLVDHFEAIHAAYSEVFVRLNLNPPDYTTVRRAIGGSVSMTMSRLLPAERVDQAVAILREIMPSMQFHGLREMTGAGILLRQLRERGVRSAVLTNKDGPVARAICTHLKWTELLDGVFGALDTAFLKPAPEFTRHTIESLGGNPEETVVVGDSPFDLATARNAGLAALLVATGTHTETELREEGAAHVYPDLPHLAREAWGIGCI